MHAVRLPPPCSARQVGGRSATDWLTQMGWDSDHNLLIEHLPRLAEEDVFMMLEELEVPRSATAIGPVIDVSEGDPLMVRVLVEDLANGHIDREGLAERPPGLTTYFHTSFERLARPGRRPNSSRLSGVARIGGVRTC